MWAVCLLSQVAADTGSSPGIAETSGFIDILEGDAGNRNGLELPKTSKAFMEKEGEWRELFWNYWELGEMQGPSVRASEL